MELVNFGQNSVIRLTVVYYAIFTVAVSFCLIYRKYDKECFHFLFLSLLLILSDILLISFALTVYFSL